MVIAFRTALITAALVLSARGPAAAQAPAARAPADRLDGPPAVTAKAWAVADGRTGKVLWGSAEAEARPMASTTKIMTAWLVLRAAADEPGVLDEEVVFSARAAGTPGSWSRLRTGDRLALGEQPAQRGDALGAGDLRVRRQRLGPLEAG